MQSERRDDAATSWCYRERADADTIWWCHQLILSITTWWYKERLMLSSWCCSPRWGSGVNSNCQSTPHILPHRIPTGQWGRGKFIDWGVGACEPLASEERSALLPLSSAVTRKMSPNTAYHNATVTFEQSNTTAAINGQTDAHRYDQGQLLVIWPEGGQAQMVLTTLAICP